MMGVKFDYIFVGIKLLERDFGHFAVNLLWHFLDILIDSKL